MQIKINHAENAETFLPIEEFIGMTFDSYEEMDEFQDNFEKIYGDSVAFTYTEHLTDEEEDEEWDRTLISAFEESEETGQPFDHIMGEILGGVR